MRATPSARDSSSVDPLSSADHAAALEDAVKGFIIGTIVTAIAFYILVQLSQNGALPIKFDYSGGVIGLVVISVIFGVINGLIGPIVKTLALPITFVTMGLVGFVINAALLLATAFVSKQVGFTLKVGDYPPNLTADTLLAALVGAVILSVISTAIRLVVRD
jgi:putative membrane protein